MKESELAQCLQELVKIVAELRTITISSEEAPELEQKINDLDTRVQELCSEQGNFMIDNSYR